jgi:hypothetical protein
MLKNLQRRINNKKSNNQQNLLNKRNYDYQLLFIILVQPSVYIISTLPFASYLLYAVITMDYMKSNIQNNN